MGERHTTPTGPDHDRRTRRRRATTMVLAAATLALAACAGGDDDSADEPAAEFATDGGVQDAAAIEVADGETASTGSTPTGSAGLDLGIVGRDVIIEMHVVMSSDDIARSVASISAAASQLGGGVASSSVDYGDPSVGDRSGHAVLVVKVPPERLDRLLSGLDATGVVRSMEQSAQDVTEQLVDLDVRIENARESVANVRDFMAQATDLNQLVTLESELTMRQTELERLEAQQRNLTDRVTLSTVTIEIVPTTSVPEPAVDEDESLGDAVRAGWQALATFVFAIVYVLAVIMPFLVVAAIVGALAWAVARRRRHRGPVETTSEDDIDPDRGGATGGELVGAGAVSGDESASRPE